MPSFTSETGRRARRRKAGLASARYWRSRRFANLVKARAVLAERRRRDSTQHTIVACSVSPRLWHCTCGLNGWGEESIIRNHRKALGLEP